MTTAQLALYPIRTEHLGPAVGAALAAIRESGLAVEVGRMSTTLVGTDDDVFSALKAAFQAAAGHGEVVLVVTVSNAC
ncbi:MAG: thiamine-binding protein [Chloroflexi bacterium]|nr:thiamine-binding protein [Chloroflexota bacterium]